MRALWRNRWGFPRETAGERSEQHVSAVTVKTSGEMCRMRDSRRKAETHHGSDPTTEGTPGTFPGATGGSMKWYVFRLPRARAAGTPHRLALQKEQLCIVMFLAILLFCFFCYIIFRLKTAQFFCCAKEWATWFRSAEKRIKH